MKEKPLIILGHGRLGREIASWMRVDELPFKLVGFLDDTHTAPDVIGPMLGHTPQAGHVYLTVFGDGAARHAIRKAYINKGAAFTTLIAPVARAATPLTTSINSIFQGCCSISSDVALGDDLLIQGFAVIGHDVVIGDGCTISSHAFLGGGAKLGRFCTVHPHAVILPDVEIGEGSIVGAGSVVIKNVAPYTTVFGSPAKVISHGKPAN